MAETKFSRVSTNQKHYLDLGSDTSSVWNFYARYSDIVQMKFHGISALVTQTSLCEGLSGDLAKHRLFSQATNFPTLPYTAGAKNAPFLGGASQ